LLAVTNGVTGTWRLEGISRPERPATREPIFLIHFDNMRTAKQPRVWQGGGLRNTSEATRTRRPRPATPRASRSSLPAGPPGPRLGASTAFPFRPPDDDERARRRRLRGVAARGPLGLVGQQLWVPHPARLCVGDSTGGEPWLAAESWGGRRVRTRGRSVFFLYFF